VFPPLPFLKNLTMVTLKGINGSIYSQQDTVWQPIKMLCEYVLALKNLTTDFISLERKICEELSIDLKKFVSKNDFQYMFVNMGQWSYISIDFNTGDYFRIVGDKELQQEGISTDIKEINKEINKQHKLGFTTFSPYVDTSGKLIAPIHHFTIKDINEFICFLDNCGGFRKRNF